MTATGIEKPPLYSLIFAENHKSIMSARAFLIECSAPHWIGVVRRLCVDGIVPTYWTAWQYAKDEIQSAFPKVTFHDTIYAKMGLNPDGIEQTATIFDEICEKVWREDAQVLYDQMNRFDHSRDMNMVERSTLLYSMLIYWRHQLKRHNPDVVIFPAPPHVVYDYVILCLCRALGVRTIMFEEATIYPPYSLTMRDFREGAQALTNPSDRFYPPSEQTLNIVERLRGIYAHAKPAREVVAHAARDKALLEGVAALKELRRNALRDEISGKKLKIVNQSSLYKERGKSLRNSFIGKFSATRYFHQLIKDWHVSRELNDAYRKMVTSKPTGRGIYVPLAGQPERTSNPQADIYTNQILMINILAMTAPTGWKVWVKEHPNQFHPQFAVNMCRSIEYYSAVGSIPNVEILSTDMDPFEAIDRANVVATTGGTAALEAVARGKQALLFGDAWYRHCPGIHRVKSHLDVASFFRSYSEDQPVNSDSFIQYLERIRMNGFVGIADYPPADYPVEQSDNEVNLHKVIIDALAEA